MNFRRYLETNPKSTYPESVLKQVYLLSAQKPNMDAKAQIFGSYIYRFQKYPGDIDLLENFNCESCKTEDEVVNKFFIALKKIIKNVLALKEEYYSEVKCGIDYRYNLELGDAENGKWYPDNLLLGRITDLHYKKLLSDSEFEILRKILVSNEVLNANDYDVVKYILREHYILRWTSKEVLDNKKVLPGNVTFKFTDGLRMDSLVKIDVITIINSRIVETTNVYYLAYKVGEEYHQLQSGNKILQLKDEIEKLYYSDMFYSPFKMAKRIYAFARGYYLANLNGYINNPSFDKYAYETILNKVLPFLSGDISLLYQLKSEIDTIVLLLEKFKKPSERSIHKTLDEMKMRIAKILVLNNHYVDVFAELLNDVNAAKNNNHKIELLEEISKQMKRIINFETITYFKSVNMNPPPEILLPYPLIYNDIIRKPEDEPINPLKLVSGGYGCNCSIDDQNEQGRLKLMNILDNYQI